MKIQLSRRKTILIPVFLILVMTAFGAATKLGTVNPRPNSQDNHLIAEKLVVENMTQAFQVITAVSDGNLIRLSLRNTYGQAINGFTLSAGKNSGVQVDFTNSDRTIAPGAVYDYAVSAASLEPPGTSIKRWKLTILNVVFEDGTGDGDPEATANIMNRRRGEKIALSHILPLLDQALNSSAVETPEDVQRLKKEISDVCESLEKEQTGEVQGGILHGKAYILGDIQQLEEQRLEKGTLRNGLVTIREHYGKKARKLKD